MSNSSSQKITAACPLPRVGISACLLGHQVRYDGKVKHYAQIDKLRTEMAFIAVCPEMATGLGMPRPAIQLVDDRAKPRAVEVLDAGIDVSAALRDTARQWLTAHPDLHGYITRSRSPSCGYQSTPIYSSAGEQQALGDGLFIEVLRQLRPQLAIIDELALQDKALRHIFLKRLNEACNE